MAAKRFFLGQDNDSHWYVIPVGERSAWEKWCNLPSENEQSWDVPQFASAVGGSPGLVTFTDPRVED